MRAVPQGVSLQPMGVALLALLGLGALLAGWVLRRLLRRPREEPDRAPDTRETRDALDARVDAELAALDD